MLKESTKQCKAITKYDERCKNPARRGGYCWMHSFRYNKTDRIITIVFFVLATILAIYLFLIGPSLANQEKLLINDEEIRLNILGQNLKYYPGRVFTLLALLKENSTDEQEEYIFDYGRRSTPNRARVFVYIDSENNLIFTLVDAKGQKHAVHINSKSNLFEFNRKYLWYFEYGNHSYESYLRVFANGKLIGEKTINQDIDIGTLIEENEFTMGASLFGFFPSHFDCWTTMVSKDALNNEEKRKLLNILYDKKLTDLFGKEVPKWARFDGTFYYLSINSGDLKEMIPKIN